MFAHQVYLLAGVFQSYYETDVLASKTASQISWIGSIQLGVMILGTVVVGPVFDVGYLKTLLVLGTFLTVLGIMCTSVCKEYWQFVLAQGVCTGLGTTCFFVPSISIIPGYFIKRRALATGLAATGSSIGR
jgi:MFS family permease